MSIYLDILAPLALFRICSVFSDSSFHFLSFLLNLWSILAVNLLFFMTIETHPLEPFLPENARVLFLGSFPPPKAKWSMEFFYPNWINDFWRIMGLIYFGDKAAFESRSAKKFDRETIVSFCIEKSFAFYDSAVKVCRLKDNASDNFLEILEPTDIPALLAKIPHCNTIVTTGGKSSEEVASILNTGTVPAIGNSIPVLVGSREVLWYRVPSSSRAFPMKIDQKADYYRLVLAAVGLI